MAGDLEQLLAHDVRRVDEIVAVPQDEVTLVRLDLVADDGASRMPENESRTDALIGGEEIERVADDAMVATLRLLEAMQVGVELVLREPGSAVDLI
jgi:hypothetical protein